MKWTTEKLQEEANKYQTRSEFYKNNASYYVAARHNKLLDELFKNHKNKGYCDYKKYSGYWTKEKLQEEANKYKTRGEFTKNNKSAYSSAVYKKLLNELFKNHTNNGYSDKNEWKENSYVIYVYELPEFNKAYVGLTNNVNRRDKEHLFNDKELLSIFCKENKISLPNYKILEEKLSSNEAKTQECYWLDYYKNNDWILFNVSKPGSLGGGVLKWTKNKLQIEANKYHTIKEFRENNKPAYSAANKLKLIVILFKNKINNGYSNKRKIPGYWNKELLQEIANEYKTRVEFRKCNYPAYLSSNKQRLLDELFKNHINQGYIRKPKKSE